MVQLIRHISGSQLRTVDLSQAHFNANNLRIIFQALAEKGFTLDKVIVNNRLVGASVPVLFQ